MVVNAVVVMVVGVAKMEDLNASEIIDRLKLAANATSDTALALALGVSQQAVSNARRGKFPAAWAPIAAKRLKVSTDWIFFGTGPMRAGQDSLPALPGSEVARRLIASRAQAESAPSGSAAGSQRIIDCDDCQIMMMPMVEARLSAGTGSFETGEIVERRYAFRMDFLMRKGQPASMVLMRVSGDSMEPEVHHNDVVLIDQSQRVPRPGLLYAVGVEDAVYLKVVNTLPGKLVMTSFNQAYPPIEVDARGDLEDGIRIIGKAVWIGRELT